MSVIFYDSIFSLDKIYRSYRFLSYFSVNDYQLLTIFWNLFLALIPLALYLLLKKYWLSTGLKSLSQKITALTLFFAWLLFFPNAAYLMTDIRHLLDFCPAGSPFKVCRENAWMIIFFFSYSSVGWVVYYYLLKLMAELISRIFSKFYYYYIFVVLAVPLASLGVLLGLLNRFNSLDVIIFPGQFLAALPLYFTDFNYLVNWMIFTVFLYLLYFGGDVIFRKIKI